MVQHLVEEVEVHHQVVWEVELEVLHQAQVVILLVCQALEQGPPWVASHLHHLHHHRTSQVYGVCPLHYSLTWCWLLCRYRALGKRRGMRSRYVDPLNKGGAPQAPMTAPPGARTRRSAAPPKFTVFKPT